jgi:hypothetical protein
LTQAEEVLLLRAIELGTQAGFTEAEAITVWEWARKARINQCLLDLTLDGHLAIKFRDGEIVFITVPASTAEEPPNASIAAMSKKFL